MENKPTLKQRNIKYIVIHCTATPADTKVTSIVNYWKNILKWKNPGYHIIVDKKGEIHQLADISKMTNGVRGYNQESIHIAYIGGIDERGIPHDNKTKEQEITLLKQLIKFKTLYPAAEVLGHRDFPGVSKACPSFDVRKWLM